MRTGLMQQALALSVIAVPTTHGAGAEKSHMQQALALSVIAVMGDLVEGRPLPLPSRAEREREREAADERWRAARQQMRHEVEMAEKRGDEKAAPIRAEAQARRALNFRKRLPRGHPERIES